MAAGSPGPAQATGVPLSWVSSASHPPRSARSRSRQSSTRRRTCVSSGGGGGIGEGGGGPARSATRWRSRSSSCSSRIRSCWRSLGSKPATSMTAAATRIGALASSASATASPGRASTSDRRLPWSRVISAYSAWSTSRRIVTCSTPAAERGDQAGEQVVGGRGERLVAADKSFDRLAGGSVHPFQRQPARPALFLQHDHAVGGERQSPDKGDVDVDQGGVVHLLLLSSGRGRRQHLLGQWGLGPARPRAAPRPRGEAGPPARAGAGGAVPCGRGWPRSPAARRRTGPGRQAAPAPERRPRRLPGRRPRHGAGAEQPPAQPQDARLPARK